MVNNIHKIIRSTFKVKSKYDNMPILAKLGGRIRLAKLLGELKYNIGAEIGVREGIYSKILCQANPDIELYCIDSWEAPKIIRKDYYSTAVKMLSPYNTTIIKKRSLDVVNDFKDNSLDFVYIDANHTFDYIVLDIINWSKKVKPGGIIACHDYYNFHHSGVIQAVNAYTYCHKINPWYVTKEKEPTAFWVKSIKEVR